MRNAENSGRDIWISGLSWFLRSQNRNFSAKKLLKEKRQKDFWVRSLWMIMELEEIRDEEQDAFDNLPEGIQESERGEQMEEYISQMESAIDDMENAKSSLEEVFNS